VAHVDVIRGQHDLLVLLDRAVHVEDQRVRIPRKKIVLGSAYQVRRREPAERRVVKIELDGGITLAELLLHGFGPGLRGDGLAVKKDPQFPQGLRGGLAELAHAALDERGARVFPGRCGQDRKQPQEEEGGTRGIGRRLEDGNRPMGNPNSGKTGLAWLWVPAFKRGGYAGPCGALFQ
jgi:hypothetical protein